MTTTWLVLVAGGLLGAGLVVVVAGLKPARPDLADAIERLLPAQTPTRLSTASNSRFDARRQELLVRAARTLGLARYASDLRMVELAPETLAARKLTYAAVGVAFPAVMSALMALGHVRLPIGVPAGAGLVLGAIFFVLPDVNQRQEATAARARMRTATCVYLELVAMERLADAGPTEALDRAAAVGGSREFARIRDALLRAELAGQPSWAGLTDLAATTGVTELGDAADIMRMAGRDGAAVYATLRARAASLRTQLLAASTAKANAASEHMVVPVALLGLCFMALLGYPAFVRILLS
jgi:hypothetical protein